MISLICAHCAKQDSAWEMFKKLVKRNKGVSITTAAALVIVAALAGFFLKVNYDARVQAENSNAAFLKEQERRRGSLRQIGNEGGSNQPTLPAAEFWKRYDAGKLKK